MIADDEQVLIKYKFRYKVLSFFLRIEWVAPKLNCFFAGCNKKKCIHCNKCVISCPTQSMYFKENGKLKIRHTCAMCMKCTLECPKDAIRFGFMNPWKVNGLFNFDKLVKDDSLDPSYINANTSDYFKHFRKYMKEQNILLEKYGIPIPVKYTKENDLSNYKK